MNIIGNIIIGNIIRIIIGNIVVGNIIRIIIGNIVVGNIVVGNIRDFYRNII